MSQSLRTLVILGCGLELAGAFVPFSSPYLRAPTASMERGIAAAPWGLRRGRLVAWGEAWTGGDSPLNRRRALEIESPFDETFAWRPPEPALQTVDVAAQVWSDGKKVRLLECRDRGQHRPTIPLVPPHRRRAGVSLGRRLCAGR